jgi:hypothetical protein
MQLGRALRKDCRYVQSVIRRGPHDCPDDAAGEVGRRYDGAVHSKTFGWLHCIEHFERGVRPPCLKTVVVEVERLGAQPHGMQHA